MSSSLQRTRSIRRPTITSADSRTKRTEPEPQQNASSSRLPVKPLTRSASIATSSGATATGPRSSRPAAGTIGRSVSVRQPATSSSSPSSQEPVKKESSSRYPPSTTVTRSRGTAVRPSSAEGPTTPQTKRVVTHTRAKSTATGLNGATVLRPPTKDASSSSTTTTTTTTAAAATATTTRTTLARKGSILEKPTAPTAQEKPRLRPAFSTLQQHYSPAKSSAPKPLTSTFLAPPSPSKLPANVAASAETNRLQTELLQLHLLHRDAATVDAEWRASAKQKLGGRFAKIAEAGRGVDEREWAEAERENVLALRRWAAGGGLEERIQALDAVINGLWTLGEPGGRYARVVRRFERWVDRMCELEEARKDGGRFLQQQDVLFVGELDASWKDECPGIMRRLDGWKRQLEEIGEVPPQGEGEEVSSLQKMIEYSRGMIHDMLAELNIMGDIEREALAREDEWIQRMNRDDEVDDTPRAGAIWRAV